MEQLCLDSSLLMHRVCPHCVCVCVNICDKYGVLSTWRFGPYAMLLKKYSEHRLCACVRVNYSISLISEGLWMLPECDFFDPLKNTVQIETLKHFFEVFHLFLWVNNNLKSWPPFANSLKQIDPWSSVAVPHLWNWDLTHYVLLSLCHLQVLVCFWDKH